MGIVQLGGITVYGPSQAQALAEIERIGSVIIAKTSACLAARRSVLLKLVADELKTRLEQRLFGAILNSRLRFGLLDTLICEAEAGTEYRIYIEANQQVRLNQAIKDTYLLLKRKKRILVKEVEQTLFSGRAYNTWSAASHVLARLVFQGRAQYVDRMTFRLPAGLDHALLDSYK